MVICGSSVDMLPDKDCGVNYVFLQYHIFLLVDWSQPSFGSEHRSFFSACHFLAWCIKSSDSPWKLAMAVDCPWIYSTTPCIRWVLLTSPPPPFALDDWHCTDPLKFKLLKVLWNRRTWNYCTKSCPAFECITRPAFYKAVWVENKQSKHDLCLSFPMSSSPAGIEGPARLPEHKPCTKQSCSDPDWLHAGCLVHWACAHCLHQFPPKIWELCFDQLVHEHKDKLTGTRVHSHSITVAVQQTFYLHLDPTTGCPISPLLKEKK